VTCWYCVENVGGKNICKHLQILQNFRRHRIVNKKKKKTGVTREFNYDVNVHITVAITKEF